MPNKDKGGNYSLRSMDADDNDSISQKKQQRSRKPNYFGIINDKIPARLVLYLLSWSGFLVSFMMRNDINFALVAMTHGENSNATGIGTFDNNANSNNDSSKDGPPQYMWSSTMKSVIISSFYWCYVLAQVVGGLATQYFGTKKVFGWSQFATALCSVLIPSAAGLSCYLVIILRSIQGFASGLTWPAMYAIVGYWIPLTERSRFMSSFQGFSIGIGLTYSICGFLIDNFGWPTVFYTTGSLGMMWCVFWYFLAFNTPQEHPRISASELFYIDESIGSEVKPGQLETKVPWKSILTSMPAWSIGITTFGRIWIHYIFIVSGPNFMKYILKFEYKENGFLSGMPFICSYISSLIFCYIADKMIVANCLTLTNVRKLFTALSQILPGALIYWIGYIDDIVLLIVLWFIAVTFITASYAGAMANIVDIAPNFAGPVLAFCQTIHMSASFLSPLANGIIVKDETSIDQWRIVFGTSSIITILTYVIYQIYGTGEIQKWNYVQGHCSNSSNNSQEDETVTTILIQSKNNTTRCRP